MEKASDALKDATVLRLGLGQPELAIKDADLFNRNYGGAKPAEAAQVAFAIGAHFAEKGDADAARKRLVGAMGQIDKSATLDIQLQAHAILARMFAKLKQVPQATGEYTKVRNLWKDPAAAVKKIESAASDEADKTKRLVKALTAVGESLFFFAEQKRAVADLIKFPSYTGAGDRETVLKHVKEKVGPWMNKKKDAIEEAEKEYVKILDLQPVPPPRWVIAAGSKDGQLWGKFVAEFRASPVPKEWKTKQDQVIPGTDGLTYGELLGEYWASLDNASEPFKQRAKAAYAKCLNLSVKYQYFDDLSRQCEIWLSKNYATEYHLVDEFRGAPNRVGTGLNDRLLPLNIDGTVYRPEVPEAAPATKPEANLEAAPSPDGAVAVTTEAR